jgi:hypothetical protein
MKEKEEAVTVRALPVSNLKSRQGSDGGKTGSRPAVIPGLRLLSESRACRTFPYCDRFLASGTVSGKAPRKTIRVAFIVFPCLARSWVLQSEMCLYFLPSSFRFHRLCCAGAE